MKGIAIGADRLESVEFEGTIFVNTKSDNDWIGSVFSFQVGNVKLFQHYCLYLGYFKFLPLNEF